MTFSDDFVLPFERQRRGPSTFWSLRDVIPATDVAPVPGKTLVRHGQSQQGYIRRIDVDNDNCTFDNADALTAITICASKKGCEPPK